jgi:hypothetical protein
VRNERRVRIRDRFEIDRRLPLVDQTVVDAKLGKPAEDDRLRVLPGLPIQAGERRNVNRPGVPTPIGELSY